MYNSLDMFFYQIQQYGRFISSIADEPTGNKKSRKYLYNQIVSKAKTHVDNKEMLPGEFEVVVCNTIGEEIDAFLSSTENKY